MTENKEIKEKEGLKIYVINGYTSNPSFGIKMMDYVIFPQKGEKPGYFFEFKGNAQILSGIYQYNDKPDLLKDDFTNCCGGYYSLTDVYKTFPELAPNNRHIITISNFSQEEQDLWKIFIEDF